MATSRTAADILRQSLNLMLVPALIILSSMPQWADVGRDIASQASTETNLLVPIGFAFSIWGPIFLGIVIYALYQALPREGGRDIHRKIGWWAALGFAGASGWAYFTSFAPLNLKDWGSSLVFIPGSLALAVAMVMVSRRKTALTTADKWAVWFPVSLMAGWMSIAQFLSYNSTLMPYFLDWGWSETGASLMVLGLALWYISYFLSKSGGNPVYVFPVLWGLSLLIYARMTGNKDLYNTPIAIAAGAAILILLAIAVMKRRNVSHP